jgi:hypothetical protein
MVWILLHCTKRVKHFIYLKFIVRINKLKQLTHESKF